ncbi:hypothetical protein BB560_003933 [Smittium megazygosporum]|uniref:SGTA homodimerisation domain-containing protein n=1 Tax=Smittium megazygosporum TaxID=133381 RepID=A0A2T9ZAK0_9FUNG|nr:hypothetical protein BB560_003933 [Smittium megazygosporum]
MAQADYKDLVSGFVKFLDDASKNPSALSPDGAENLEIAKQCLMEAFGIDDDYKSEKIDFEKTPLISLLSNSGTAPAKVSKSEPSSEKDEKKAEEFKAKGNAFMSGQNYEAAIEEYTKAIQLNNENSVYYANRSAAYCQLRNYSDAEKDAQIAVDIDPTYAKAYNRLGHAHYGLENFEEALKAYEEALNLDPSNLSTKSYIDSIKQKIGSNPSPASGASRGSGGLPDMSSLLSNPAFASMAQNLMSSGAMDQILGNPEISKMAQDFRSSGQMPSLNELMDNPALRDMAGKISQKPNGAQNPSSNPGSNPNLNDLLSNPELMEMASKFMKGNK